MATMKLSMSAPVIPGAAVRTARPAQTQRYSGAIAFNKASSTPSTLRRSAMRGDVASLKPAKPMATISRGRSSAVSVTAQVPLPPKSISYGFSALWFAAGMANMFATSSVIEASYAAAVTPVMTLMVKQLGTCMLAIAGAMCAEAKTHSPPTAAGIILMAASCAAFVFSSKALLTPTFYTACLVFDGVTFFYFLWKKFAEKMAAKALRTQAAS